MQLKIYPISNVQPNLDTLHHYQRESFSDWAIPSRDVQSLFFFFLDSYSARGSKTLIHAPGATNGLKKLIVSTPDTSWFAFEKLEVTSNNYVGYSGCRSFSYKN